MAETITTEQEANALPVGTIIRDNMGDARQKVSGHGWEQAGEAGKWGPSWIAFPAQVLWTPPRTLYVVCNRLLDPETNEYCEFDGDVTFENRQGRCPGCRRLMFESEGDERLAAHVDGRSER